MGSRRAVVRAILGYPNRPFGLKPKCNNRANMLSRAYYHQYGAGSAAQEASAVAVASSTPRATARLRVQPLGDRKKRLATLLAGRRLGIVLSDRTDEDGATISLFHAE
jgi:hypothetical protein